MELESMAASDRKGGGPRVCVYTVLIGQYERLNEQAVAAQSHLPFICLTDDPDLKSESWQIRRVSSTFGMDPIRSQRDFKIRPHLYLSEFDASLYVDNSVLLTQPPERLIERYPLTSGFCLPDHSFRDSILDEFLEVARLGFDDQSRIFEQLNHYAIDCPEVLQEKPYWTGILLRDHRNPTVRAMLEIWAAHVQRYSRRDQLSVNVAFRLAGLTPDVIWVDTLASWFHSWPHTEGRDREKGMRRPAVSLAPPVARIRQLEQALAEQARQHAQALAEQARQHAQVLAEQARQRDVLFASRSWHVAMRLSRCAHRCPRLARLVRRGLKLFEWTAALRFRRRLVGALPRRSWRG